jgi:hypothetical protein
VNVRTMQIDNDSPGTEISGIELLYIHFSLQFQMSKLTYLPTLGAPHLSLT